MGPRSENRGYGSHLGHALWTQGRLQWVHGPRTVVMFVPVEDVQRAEPLQWVHGPRTVVMMGESLAMSFAQKLQWVHGPRTVVMSLQSMPSRHGPYGFNGSTVREPWLCRTVNAKGVAEIGDASMGPRSENRGYAD